MLNLRPYQKECLEKIKKSYEGGTCRQLVSLPTGAGKTVVFANLIKEISCSTLVLAHTDELLKQAKQKIEMICPDLDVGIVNSDYKEFNKSVVVSSIQALYRTQNLAPLVNRNFGLLIYDECHHSSAEMSRKVIEELGFGPATKRLFLGMTATPTRQDGRGLGEIFDSIVYEKTIKDMIQEGYLCKPKGLKVATDLDMGSVKSTDGDYQASSLAKVMDTPELINLVIKAYQEHAEGLPTICFATSVQHAKNLAEAFKKINISSEAIYGDMPKEERAILIEQYRTGKISILTNCQVLTEGFDAPETSCIIVARPTKSPALYQQMVGRGLRLFPNKRECIILDFGDRAHTLCTIAMLFGDAEYLSHQEELESEEYKREILEKLPPNLNKKLKTAILNFDPLGEDFIWQKDGKLYALKGRGKTKLEIVPKENETFSVLFTNNPGGTQCNIADGLSFEYAFATAEDFAREHRHLFIVSDKDAAWRNLPISEKQSACLRSYGYKAGIENLTRGQASVLIGSGTLKRAS